jgi:hypothetical protein
MKSTARIIAALSFVAVAGCAGNMDQIAAHDEATQIMTVSALKVAIADNGQSGNVYEYSSPTPMPAAKPVQYAVANGNVFEYY